MYRSPGPPSPATARRFRDVRPAIRWTRMLAATAAASATLLVAGCDRPASRVADVAPPAPKAPPAAAATAGGSNLAAATSAPTPAPASASAPVLSAPAPPANSTDIASSPTGPGTDLAPDLVTDADRAADLMKKGDEALSASRWPEAVAHYEASLRLDAESEATHFDVAIRINPGHALSLNNRGTALGRLGRTAEAATEFARAVSLKGDYLEARFNLGNAYQLLGDAPGAEAQYREILRLQPDFQPARTALERIAQARLARP